MRRLFGSFNSFPDSRDVSRARRKLKLPKNFQFLSGFQKEECIKLLADRKESFNSFPDSSILLFLFLLVILLRLSIPFRIPEGRGPLPEDFLVKHLHFQFLSGFQPTLSRYRPLALSATHLFQFLSGFQIPSPNPKIPEKPRKTFNSFPDSRTATHLFTSGHN